MRAGATGLRGAAPRAAAETPLNLPRLRSPIVFGTLALLFAGLAGRSIYLQSVDHEFLQTQGTARHSRELEVPAHRGRIIDRSGEATRAVHAGQVAVGVPDKFEATTQQLSDLARILETTPQKLSARLDANEDFAFLAKQIAPRAIGARDGAAHQGPARPERVPALLSGGRSHCAHRGLHRRS